MKVGELFDRCRELTAVEPSAATLRYLHQTLVLACNEALRDTRQGFGNIFSQVDWLCKRHGISMRERMAIQQMRRHSNGHNSLSKDDWLYDLRALAVFISAIFKTDIPHDLQTLLPAKGKAASDYQRVSQRYQRCIVTAWDDAYIYATTDDGPVSIKLTDSALPTLLTEGMQLNLLDCKTDGTTIEAGLIVVEPDFLVDISSIAACFQEYGHHPVSYLLSQLKPRSNTQPILLGNFAGAALDDLINPTNCQLSLFGDTLRNSFREQALQFCTCEGFNPVQFKADGQQQVEHIREAVDVLFGHFESPAKQGTDAKQEEDGYDRSHALLEPSFVCEQLGLQGRVDLMTDDMRLLVEQKSGKNWNIECPTTNTHHQHKEDHYVQLLLYYGVLRYNFHLSADQVDIRLLYSKYPARQGLLVVNFYQQLFREAISLRNHIVALETRIAREGFGTVMPLLRPSVLLQNQQKGEFFNRYIRPVVEQIVQPLQQLSATERDYVERMLTFVYREQLAQKIGVQEGQGGAWADLWNMPIAEKLETGNILMGLQPTILRAPLAPTFKWENPIQPITLTRPSWRDSCNFRRGDMVYLYRYEGEPDVRANILYKGVIEQLSDVEVTVRLNNPQHNPHLFQTGTYAIEHASSDIGTTSAIRSLHAFCTAQPDRRQLLLGQRAPRRDEMFRLSHSYHEHYDDLLQKALQARDYFLLQGPPGTGKTSMALRFLVEEELGHSHHILLTAYTNRAVDEVCGILTDANIDYLRLGKEASCDPRYASHLLENVLEECPKLAEIRQRLLDIRVIVATTSTLQTHPYLLQLKRFSLCIVDEASQILEPNIIGLLASESIGRFILIGDHKQLPAVIQQPDDEPRLHDCRRSLFERLLRQEQQAGRTDFTGILRRQGRMHPDIAQFPNEMFYPKEQLQPVPLPHQTEMELDYPQPSEDNLDDLLKAHRVLFLPSDTHPTNSAHSYLQVGELYHSDKVNAAEAHIVADLLRRIYRQYGDRFHTDQTVGVIVPYRNQIAMIRHEIEQLGTPQLLDISIDTVERYQGSQRDVIIYSFTVQRPYQLDFLTANCFEESDGVYSSASHVIDRKLNVVMTRARKQLIMTGNVNVLQQNSLFAELIRRFHIKATGQDA